MDYVASPSKSGSDFLYWSKSINGGSYSFTTPVDSQGGSAVPDHVVEAGQKVMPPPAPAKENNVFLYWEYNNVPYNFSKPVVESMTLKAFWRTLPSPPGV